MAGLGPVLTLYKCALKPSNLVANKGRPGPQTEKSAKLRWRMEKANEEKQSSEMPAASCNSVLNSNFKAAQHAYAYVPI